VHGSYIAYPIDNSVHVLVIHDVMHHLHFASFIWWPHSLAIRKLAFHGWCGIEVWVLCHDKYSWTLIIQDISISGSIFLLNIYSWPCRVLKPVDFSLTLITLFSIRFHTSYRITCMKVEPVKSSIICIKKNL
jgi:hypothetical protein